MTEATTNDFYFGRYTCAICLSKLKHLNVRYMPTLLEADKEIPGGQQNVHLTCYQEYSRAGDVNVAVPRTSAGIIDNDKVVL